MTYEIKPAGAGGWLAIAAGTRLLVVPELDDVAAAWAALTGPDGFQAALDRLTSRGLGATPPFALIEWEPGVDARIILRGDATIAVTDAGGEQQLTAAGVSTWVERILPGITALTIVVPGAVPVGEHTLPLALGAGLVASVSTAGAAASGAPAAVDAAASSPQSPPRAPAPEPATQRPTPAEPTPPQPLEEATVVVGIDESSGIVPPAPQPAEDEQGYDYLFGDTMYRSVSDAAVVAPDAEGESVEAPGDHDGHTVLTSDLARVRGQRKSRTAPPRPDPQPATRFALVVSTTGAREPLTGSVLVGRSPSVSKVTGGGIPRLLTLGNGDQDISRNHAQISVEGGTAVVTDLHSKNGTAIILPGKDSQRLRAGEPTAVIPGTVIDLGGGITLTLEED